MSWKPNLKWFTPMVEAILTLALGIAGMAYALGAMRRLDDGWRRPGRS